MRISDLIKNGLLTSDREYCVKDVINGVWVTYILSLTDTNRVEFYAKVCGYALPCCCWFVNRKTTLDDLVDAIRDRV